MIPLVALVVAAPGFRFAGGDDLALLRALKPKVEGPMVAVAYPDRISGFSFQTDDRFWTRFEREARRKREGSTGLALQRGDYPPPAFGSTSTPAVFADFDVRAFVAGGKVVGETDGAFKAGELNGCRWSKTLRMHYLYREVPIVALGRGASERTFLKTAAAALGAKFVETDSYELKFDPAEFKSRIVPTVDNWRRRQQGRGMDKDMKIARMSILREALAAMTVDEIAKAFATPQSNSVVGRPTMMLKKALEDYFANLRTAAMLNSTPKDMRLRAQQLQDVDPAKAVSVSIYGDFYLMVAAAKRGGGTIYF